MLQRILGTAPLTGGQWLVCLGVAVGLLLTDKTIKLGMRSQVQRKGDAALQPM